MGDIDIANSHVRPGRHGFLRRFRRDAGGATVIEFGILALPFSLLVFAILESCISFAGQQVMTNAADDVARLYRTGQLKPGDIDSERLRDMICEPMEIMVRAGCPGLKVDLRQFSTFAEAASQRIVIENGELKLDFKFDPGPAMSKNMLRVYYEWPVMTDLLRRSMSTLNGGKTLHFASVTWQNEPYSE